MNFKNLAENLIITIVVGLLCAVIGYLSSVYSNKNTIREFRPMIEEAIRKETTHISNEFKTEIKKLKAKKDSKVILETTPEVNSSIELKKRKRKWFNLKR